MNGFAAAFAAGRVAGAGRFAAGRFAADRFTAVGFAASFAAGRFGVRVLMP